MGVLFTACIYAECVDPTPVWSCYNLPDNQQQNCHCISWTEYNLKQITSGANSIVYPIESNTITDSGTQETSDK